MNINVSKKTVHSPFLSLTLSLFVSLTLWLFDSLSLSLVFMMFLLYFCNWLECVTAFWRNRWRTRIRSFPVATWENAMSYHRKHIAPCCRSPKASSIASTKQALYNARTSLRIVCPSRGGKAKEIKRGLVPPYCLTRCAPVPIDLI